MKKIRCILLCLTLLSAVWLAGCSCGRVEDETTASFPAESGTENGSTQSNGTQNGPTQNNGPQNNHGNGGAVQDGQSGATHQGQSGTTQDGGLMEDVTDGMEELGEDIAEVVPDGTEETGKTADR